MSHFSKRAEVASHVSNNELISRIYKEISKLNENANSSIRKEEKDTKRHFAEEDIQMAERYMKRYLTTLAIADVQL